MYFLSARTFVLTNSLSFNRCIPLNAFSTHLKRINEPYSDPRKAFVSSKNVIFLTLIWSTKHMNAHAHEPHTIILKYAYWQSFRIRHSWQTLPFGEHSRCSVWLVPFRLGTSSDSLYSSDGSVLPDSYNPYHGSMLHDFKSIYHCWLRPKVILYVEHSSMAGFHA